MPLTVARIRESDCVGCTKCIDACPVDAIIGTHQKMHTVLTAECIGCGLCVAPCPMDCIEIESVEIPENQTTKLARATKAKQRYLAKTARGLKETRRLLPYSTHDLGLKAAIQTEIKAAIERVRNKKAILEK